MDETTPPWLEVGLPPETAPPRRPPASLPRRRRRPITPAAGVGLGLVALVMLAALAADIVAPGDPNAQDLRNRLAGPAWLGGTGGVLGTDHLGRDVLRRVVHGSRVSLVVGLAAVALAGSVGVTLGLAAGYLGGAWDAVLRGVADVQQAIPFLMLGIAVAVILGPSLGNVVAVLALTTWVTYFRVVRAETLAARASPMVEAARVLGAGGPRVLARHVLPNVSGSIIVVASLMVASMILFEASLSLLGLGVPPPQPTWGRMVLEGAGYVETAWWTSVFPGAAIVLTVLGINLAGDWLRDALDPRLSA